MNALSLPAEIARRKAGKTVQLGVYARYERESRASVGTLTETQYVTMTHAPRRIMAQSGSCLRATSRGETPPPDRRQPVVEAVSGPAARAAESACDVILG